MIPRGASLFLGACFQETGTMCLLNLCFSIICLQETGLEG